MKNIISKIPIPICGLMLALATGGNLIASYGVLYKNILGVISATILLLVLAKIVIQTKSVLEDLKNPVIASVAPTFSMGIMVLSTYLKPLQPSVGYLLWVLGLIVHFALIFYFTKTFIFSFNFKKVFPSYFVVYVGIVVGSVTATAFNAAAFGKVIFWFGFPAYLILLPIILYRVFVVKEIPEPALPTVTIFAAPASLCLAGYMSSFQQKNMIIVWLLLILSITTYIAVLTYMPKMLKLRFYPSYSAFTFPCVISAVASKAVNAFLIKSDQPIWALNYIVKFQEFIAVTITIYVLLRYAKAILIVPSASNTVPVNKSQNI